MQPLFFGERDKQLFGIYHPPTTPISIARAVLLCCPLAREYIYTHRALKQLAGQLAGNGFHVLRFDYFATGDSAGDTVEGSPHQWIADIHTAASELRDISGCHRINLIGWRLGATLAMSAVAGGLQAEKLVLWDPIVQGQGWLEELSSIHTELLSNQNHFPVVRQSSDDEIIGFAFPADMRNAIYQLDLTSLAARCEAATLMTTSHTHADYDALAAAFAKYEKSLLHRHIPDAGEWWTQQVEKAVLPQHIPQAIIAFLTQHS